MMASDSFRLDIRIPKGTQNEIDRISVSTGHSSTDIVKFAITSYIGVLVERGDIPPKYEPETVDVGYEMLEKIFGVRFKHGSVEE